MKPWKTLSHSTILQPDGGRFLTVEQHEVELPDGRIIHEWPWLKTPSFINVVAETEEGQFLCFRQPKYAVEGLSLAITGGYIEEGEDPLAAAQRELLEETGYVADEWISLGDYAVDGNRGCGRAHFYLARGARWQQTIDADDLEEQELLLLTREQMVAELVAGECKVLPWVANIALALLKLDKT